MGISEQNPDAFHHNESDDTDTEERESDDSHDDATFDVCEETRCSLSRLSIKKKSKSRFTKDTEEGNEEVPDVQEIDVPELAEEDRKSFEVVQKIIEVGQVEKLKVDQCKVYLRKHGLRLTGNKDTIIGRIKEHLDILSGGGEKKYPISSFVLNCKGDACTGDVVMFEQNVYEMFNIASRSASGPPCGMRIVAGRIVKESYGAAKQQHTFTIEVLWSKGEKALTPLHPLLIKGRNLYRLKTVRQRWEDESARQKILFEKHARGSLARSNREARVQLKEMRMTLKAKREARMEVQHRKPKETQKNMQEQQNERSVQSLQSLSTASGNLENQAHEKQLNMQQSHHEQRIDNPVRSPLRRPLASMNSICTEYKDPYSCHPHCGPRIPLANQIREQIMNSIPSKFPVQIHDEQRMNNPVRSPFRRPLTSMNSIRIEYKDPYSFHSRGGSMSPFRRHDHEQIRNSSPLMRRQGPEPRANFSPSRRTHAHEEDKNFMPPKIPFQRNNQQQRQLCRFYAQGRCTYGDHCKYSHDYGENQNYGQRMDEGFPSNPRRYFQ